MSDRLSLILHRDGSVRIQAGRSRGRGFDCGSACQIVARTAASITLRVPAHSEAAGYDRMAGSNQRVRVPAATHELPILESVVDPRGGYECLVVDAS